MKRTVLLVVLATLILGMAIGAQPRQTKKLRIGTMPSTIGVPVAYAYDNGYFKDEGLDVEVVMFVTGAPINEALAAKQIDVAASGLASVFSLAIGTCKWVGEINTTGGMGIYVRPNSKILSVKGKVAGLPNIFGSAETIKGISVLGPLGTSSQFNTIRYIQRFGLKDSEIRTVHMEFGPALQAFKAGQGDALAASPPFSFDAEAAGFIMAASFEDATGVELRDGLLARSEIVATRRQEVVAFVRAVYRACDALQDKALRAKYSKKWFGDNGRMYDDKTMADEIKVRDYITKAVMAKEGYLYGPGMIDIAQFFMEGGKIEKDNLPNVAKSFDVGILKEALGITVKAAK